MKDFASTFRKKVAGDQGECRVSIGQNTGHNSIVESMWGTLKNPSAASLYRFSLVLLVAEAGEDYGSEMEVLATTKIRLVWLRRRR
jgi:hypothetical protein